jgi:hypothetical protein
MAAAMSVIQRSRLVAQPPLLSMPLACLRNCRTGDPQNMPTFNTDSSLRRLLRMIPPPPEPLEIERPPVPLVFEAARPGAFPADYLDLVEKYGSGEFRQKADVSMIASIHNPRAPAYQSFLDHEHAFLRQYKTDEGGGYRAYDIHPVTPGLLQWGWAEGRKAYFWHTVGEPAQWPIIIMWDFEFAGRFDMPLLVFLERLLCGELDCNFMGDETRPIRLDPSRISFQPRRMPRG